MVVDVFIPCFIDQFYPETGFNMIKLLEKLDVEVHYNPKQTCCGQMAFNSGFR
ncbi:MAG: (Fe-S)-binding protein, partial [Bacteroidales bacterium]|nr:(Fe-S)-binding protein [Bacteroidales bacterium]